MTKCVGRYSSGTALRSKAAAGPFAVGDWPAVMSDIFGRVPVSSSQPGCLLGLNLLSNTMHHVLTILSRINHTMHTILCITILSNT